MGFKSQADIDAAYQSGYNTGYSAGQAAGVTIHTGTKNITTNTTTDLGAEHTYRYITTNVPGASSMRFFALLKMNGSSMYIYLGSGNSKVKSIFVSLSSASGSGYVSIEQSGASTVKVYEGQSKSFTASGAGNIYLYPHDADTYATVTVYF